MKEKIRIPKPYIPSPKDIKDVIAPPGIKVNSSYLKVGNKFVKILFLFTYPKELSTGWFSPIINLPETLDISIFIHPMDTSLALKQLRKKTAQIQAQISERERKGYVRDPELETALVDIEKLRDILQQGREKIFRVGLYVAIYADSLEKLKELENMVTDQLETKLVYVKPSLFQQMEGFNSILPLGQDKLMIHTPLNSGPVSSLFPFISANLISEKGILYGVNISNNSLVILDRFSMQNANMIIFGETGSGKSYANKLEILRSLMTGTNVIVIDPEKEYQPLAETVGGSFFNVSIASNDNINPFDLPKVPEGEMPEEVFRSHILELTGLLRLMLGGITAEEEAILDKALRETYSARDVIPTEPSTWSNPPLLQDLQTVLESISGGENLANRLRRFTTGSYAGFTNRPTNVDLKNRLVVFSLRDLEEELRPIAMYVILHFIWNMIRTEFKKTLVVVDEGWWMIKYPDSASFLASLVRRARKYYLGITVITQNIGDLLDSPYGKPIINNCNFALLLKQSAATAERVAESFKLTEVEKSVILNPGIGEGVFLIGENHVALKPIASYKEHQIITTKPEEVLERKQMEK